MFVTIRYGADEQLLVNPNCAAINFVNYIREKLEIEPDVGFDLCDEAGGLKGICDVPSLDLASTVLQPRASYILMLITKNENNVNELTPYLENIDTIYPGLVGKMRRMLRLADRPAPHGRRAAASPHRLVDPRKVATKPTKKQK